MPPPWLDQPPAGTSVCGGFDGSENDDFTAIRLETARGFQFTPRYGPDQRPTIWNPAEWPDHQIPREQVGIAWAEIAERYALERVYCDPGFHDEASWESDIERWDVLHGPERFISWPTNQIGRMFPATTRFTTDLKTKALTHDGCPITSLHVTNARKIAKSADRYILGKPAQHQKIDAAVTSILCHEATADALAAGWGGEPTDNRMFVLR